MRLSGQQEIGAAFVLELGRALHRYGTPSHRLETALGAMARNLELDAQFFSTPTTIMAAFGPPSNQRTALIRVEPGEVDLAKLAALDELATQIVRREVELGEGIRQVHAIEGRPAQWGRIVTVLAFALASAAAARFFGGGAPEIGVAAMSGTVLGLLSLVMTRQINSARVYDIVAALCAAGIAYVAPHAGIESSVGIATLAGVITLVPGLTLTVAMAELATRNLSAGTARLTAAAIIFLEIAFGVAAAEALVVRMMGMPPLAAGSPLPLWTEPVALLIASLAFGVLFQTPLRLAPVVVAAGVVAFYGARLGSWMIGPALGASIGAFWVGIGSNAWARWRDRSPLIPLVPGILLLVPGSVGVRGLSSLLQRDVVTGVDTLFSMVLVAVSIVAGLLAANATVSPRRSL